MSVFMGMRNIHVIIKLPFLLLLKIVMFCSTDTWWIVISRSMPVIFLNKNTAFVGVVVPDSAVPRFGTSRLCRIWDRNGSGPRFSFVTNMVSISDISSIPTLLLFPNFK